MHDGFSLEKTSVMLAKGPKYPFRFRFLFDHVTKINCQPEIVLRFVGSKREIFEFNEFRALGVPVNADFSLRRLAALLDG